MRRFLPAAALAALMVLLASRADAGYLIIRVLLEGNSGAAGPTDPGMGPIGIPPGGPGAGLRPGGELGSPDGGYSPGGSSIQNPAGTATADPTRSIVVVVPVETDLTIGAPFYTHLNHHPTSNPNWRPKLRLTHRGEKIAANLFTDSSTVQWYETFKEAPHFVRTHETATRIKHDAWARKKADLREGFLLVTEALEKGMVDDAVTWADELLAASKDKKDLPPEVAGFAKAYAAVQKGIKSAAPKRGGGERWQSRLEAPNLNQGPHYTLLSWDATEAEVQRRMAMLEENFKAFFLWHATRGVALPVPETPLTAVLTRQPSEVFRLLRPLDGPARLPADGFYSPTHDVLVLSPDRLDAVGLTFNAQVQQIYKEGVNRADLLAGKGPKVDTSGMTPGAKKPDAVARMQTLALVERLADDAAAGCAISREGTLQLLYATGQAPRHVALPEWLANGSANFFTRPKDPAFVTNANGKWLVHVAPYTGYGGTNYVLHRQFKDIYGGLIDDKRDKKEAKDQKEGRLALLKNTITDAYFLGLRDLKNVNDPDPAKADKTGIALVAGGAAGQFNPGGFFGMQPGLFGGRPQPGGPGPLGIGGRPQPPGEGGDVLGPGGMTTPPEDDPVVLARKKRARLGVKSQASAWALYFYLAKDRPGELQAFIDELAALPRDLPLDAATLTATFCRAFGLDGSNESLGRFADAWMAYLATVPSPGVDIPLVDPKPPTTNPGGMNTGPGGTGSPDGGERRP